MKGLMYRLQHEMRTVINIGWAIRLTMHKTCLPANPHRMNMNMFNVSTIKRETL